MKKVGVGLLAGVLVPGAAWACACGCGVFDVATSSMLPQGPGGMAFLNYDYQDQNQNWSGSSSAPADNNDDKKIETHFLTLGLQYMFNRSWGAQIEVPYWNRTFVTAARFAAATDGFPVVERPRRHPDHRHLHRFLRGFVGRCDVRSEAADGQLHSRFRCGGSRHSHRQRQHGHFAGRVLAAPIRRATPTGIFSRRGCWTCRC